jgi:hypothetical protein
MTFLEVVGSYPRSVVGRDPDREAAKRVAEVIRISANCPGPKGTRFGSGQFPTLVAGFENMCGRF